MSVAPRSTNTSVRDGLSAQQVAAAPVDEVMRWLDSAAAGLSSAEASARLKRFGANAVRTHRVSALEILGRQFRNNAVLILANDHRIARRAPVRCDVVRQSMPEE